MRYEVKGRRNSSSNVQAVMLCMVHTKKVFSLALLVDCNSKKGFCLSPKQDTTRD